MWQPTRSREFVGASSQYLSVAAAPVSGYPLTLFCWLYAPNPAAAGILMSVGVAGSNDHNHRLQLNAADTVGYGARDTAATVASTTVSIAYNTWQSVCGVGLSATDRWIYLNGANGVQSVVSRTPVGMSHYYIGAIQGASPASFLTGRVAHAAIWNVALTPGEVLELSQGRPPLTMRRNNLVSYHPLGVASPEPGLRGVHELTLNNAPTIATGPWLSVPRAAPVVASVAAPAGDAVPQAWMQYRARRVA